MSVSTKRYGRIRGRVLRLLAREHPGTLDAKVLVAVLSDLGYEMDGKECAGHLHYLAEKGYVNRIERKAAGMKIEMVSLTAKGLDLMDGLIVDIGVDAREE